MTSAEGYASRLTQYDNKGDLNLANEPDPSLAIINKVRILAERIRNSKKVVIHTGAGISTSAGINDFRGPNGVWTKSRSKKRRRSSESTANDKSSKTFESANPTVTHMVITAMYKKKHISHVISQNVDNLHLRSGLPRSALSELHGNVFMEWCKKCNLEYERETETETVGLTPGENYCKTCYNVLTDKALDWEDELPEMDLQKAKKASKEADLAIIVGTSCQMDPARSLPFMGGGSKKRGVSIVNLSRTQFDERIGLCIRADCDTVFALLAMELGLQLEPFRKIVTISLMVSWVDSYHLKCGIYRMRDKSCQSELINGIEGVLYRQTNVNKGPNGESNEIWGPILTKKGYEYVLEIPPEEKHEVMEVEALVKFDDRDNLLMKASISEEGKCVTWRCDERITLEEIDIQRQAEDLVKKVEKCAEDWGRGRQGRNEAKKAKEEEDIWFCCGKRRGYAQCCVCMEEIWGGSEKRGIHVEKCLLNRSKTDKQERDNVEVIVID